jgi:hypothetical protein
MVAKAIEMLLSFALIAGATAAIALPPQIAVPELIKIEVLLSIEKNFEIIKPATNVNIIELMIKPRPFEQAFVACSMVIPKPNPTIEYDNRVFVYLLVFIDVGNMFKLAIIIPSNKASHDGNAIIPSEGMLGVRQIIKTNVNVISFTFSLNFSNFFYLLDYQVITV